MIKLWTRQGKRYSSNLPESQKEEEERRGEREREVSIVDVERKRKKAIDAFHSAFSEAPMLKS